MAKKRQVRPDGGLSIITFVLCCITIVVSGYVFDTPATLRPMDMLRALDRADAAPAAEARDLRIAVGTNANLDLVASGVAVLGALGVSASPAPRDHDVIDSKAELAEVFGHFYSMGAAGERSVADPELFRALSTAARSEGVPHSVAVGGNAALMARRLHAEGAQVLLGGQVGGDLRELLPEGVATVPSADAEDQVHLILEFDPSDDWGGAAPSRDNRFIVVADRVNAEMQPLEAFAAQLEAFAPHAVVLSGLHLLETVPSPLREERLEALLQTIKAVPQSTPIHLELASMADAEFLAAALRLLLPHVDSAGCNEQELAFIVEALTGKPASADVAAHVPGVKAVAAAVSAVFRSVDADSKTRDLGRFHFHSYAFHMLVSKPSVPALTAHWGGLRSWKAAAAHGSVTATLHACQQGSVEDLAPADVKMELGTRFPGVSESGSEFEQSLVEPVAVWQKHGLEFFFAPVVQCADPASTVGLGDNISAAALAAQLSR